ncbi:hypothetical protein [Streptomyces tubercidicus]|uniref:hypothetical protein n=1 Tax=Streptomyces tubercidicus TaxID=47759 RepID=UPI003530594A
MWDSASRTSLATLTSHTGSVNGIALSPDGRTVATVGADRCIRLWDTRTHRPTAVLKFHTNEVHFVAFSPDGHTLATTAADQTTRLWDRPRASRHRRRRRRRSRSRRITTARPRNCHGTVRSVALRPSAPVTAAHGRAEASGRQVKAWRPEAQTGYSWCPPAKPGISCTIPRGLPSVSFVPRASRRPAPSRRLARGPSSAAPDRLRRHQAQDHQCLVGLGVPRPPAARP